MIGRRYRPRRRREGVLEVESYVKLGDCYELIKELADNSVDLVIIDPPYDFTVRGGQKLTDEELEELYKREYEKEFKRTNDHDRAHIRAQRIKTRYELKHIGCGLKPELLDELDRVMKATNIYIWCNKKMLKQLFEYYDNGNNYIDLICWHKNNPIPTAPNSYLNDTEYLFYAKKSGVAMYGDYYTKRKWYVTNTNKKDKKNYEHPTIKPMHIVENLIINSSAEGDVVLDAFLGSGTTAVCAKKLNRKYIGFEIDPDYFEIIQSRLDENYVSKNKTRNLFKRKRLI